MQSNQKFAIAGATALALLGVAGAYYYLQSSKSIDAATQFAGPTSTGKMSTLYKKEANLRSSLVSNVKYRIIYALLPGGKNFRGRVLVSFDLSADYQSPSDTEWAFLDYKGHGIHKMVQNGTEIEVGNIKFADDRLYFSMDHLKAGANEVTIDFESTYVRDCQGVHYF